MAESAPGRGARIAAGTFPVPLAEPGVRLSTHRALHGSCLVRECPLETVLDRVIERSGHDLSAITCVLVNRAACGVVSGLA